MNQMAVLNYSPFEVLRKLTKVPGDLVFGKSADKPVHQLAVIEHQHCRDTHYLILRGEAGALIHVDFYEFYDPPVLHGEFVY